MPIFDFECKHCGKTTESIEPCNCVGIQCECGKIARKVISAGGVYCGNGDDSSWAKDAADVMPKDSTNPVVREFVHNPTKSNLKRAMKSEGIRHIEPGEKAINREPFDVARHADKVMERQRDRRGLSI